MSSQPKTFLSCETQETSSIFDSSFQQPDSGSYNPMDQVGGGVAGALYTILAQMEKMYSELQAEYNKCAKDLTSAQQKMTEVMGKSKEQAGLMQAGAIWCQAGVAFLGAATTLGMMYAARSDTPKLQEMSTQENTLEGLHDLDNLNGTAPTHLRAGPTDPRTNPTGMPPEILARAEKMRNGDFSECSQELTIRGTRLSKDDANQYAINHMKQVNGGADHVQFKTNLRQEIHITKEGINKIQNELSYSSQSRNNKQSLLTNAWSAGGQGGQGYFTSQSATYDAGNQIAGSLKTQTDSSEGTQANALNSTYQAYLDALRAIQQGATRA